MPEKALELRIAGKATAADGVVTLTLARPDGGRLPDWRRARTST